MYGKNYEYENKPVVNRNHEGRYSDNRNNFGTNGNNYDSSRRRKNDNNNFVPPNNNFNDQDRRNNSYYNSRYKHNRPRNFHHAREEQEYPRPSSQDWRESNCGE